MIKWTLSQKRKKSHIIVHFSNPDDVTSWGNAHRPASLDLKPKSKTNSEICYLRL